MTSSLLERRDIKKMSRTQVRPRELEVEDFIRTVEEIRPVIIDANRMEIDSSRLEIERVYRFSFIDTNMVLWKSKDGTIDIYQVVEE